MARTRRISLAASKCQPRFSVDYVFLTPAPAAADGDSARPLPPHSPPPPSPVMYVIPASSRPASSTVFLPFQSWSRRAKLVRQIPRLCCCRKLAAASVEVLVGIIPSRLSFRSLTLTDKPVTRCRLGALQLN